VLKKSLSARLALQKRPETRPKHYKDGVFKSKKDLIRQLKAGEISPAFAMLVTASECFACGASYLQCGCSKLLDEDVAQRITDVRDAFKFWTDRPIRQDRVDPVG
jgi:hypothetical protein